MPAVAEMFAQFELEMPTLPGIMSGEQELELELEGVLDNFSVTKSVMAQLAIELERSSENQ